VVVEEVRDPDPPIRLLASFFEPGSGAELATQLRLWEGELVVALGAPAQSEAGERSCDVMLTDLGVAPARPSLELGALMSELSGLERFAAEEEGAGVVGEGAYETAPLVETYRERGLLVQVDGMGEMDVVAERVFAALEAREPDAPTS